MEVLKTILAGAALALCATGAAQAHVALQPAAAPTGAYQVLRFGVGHGCDGQATTSLRIELPAALAMAHPQPKPGWRLRIEPRGDGAETPAAISWTGKLPADEYDEFLIFVRLPAEGDRLAFPAVQTCGRSGVRWVETAAPGAPRPTRPAPSLELTPPAGAPHHP